jgi:hypothetical protein
MYIIFQVPVHQKPASAEASAWPTDTAQRSTGQTRSTGSTSRGCSLLWDREEEGSGHREIPSWKLLLPLPSLASPWAILSPEKWPRMGS